MKVYFVALILGILLGTHPSYAQDKNLYAKFGRGINFNASDSSMSLRFGVRFQTLFAAEKALKENSHIIKEMQIRRFRLKFDGFAFTPKLEYKIELALSNRDNAPANVKQQGFASNLVLDAVLRYSITKNMEVWFGQAKLPGNRERVISSQALQFVDRSLVNGFYNLDRDLGVQVHHKFTIGNSFVVKDRYAVSLGQGRNITATDTGGLSYTGRLEILPLGDFSARGDYFDSDLSREPKPKISMAAGYSYNDDATRKGGELGSFLKESRDLKTFFADMMIKFKGWSFTSEYMQKEADGNPLMKDTSDFFQTGNGWNIQSGYLFKNNIEIAARYTVINPSEEILNAGAGASVTEYSLGVSKYFLGHNLKIQSDVSLTDNQEESDPGIRFRFQVEMAF